MTDFIGDKSAMQVTQSERACDENNRIRAILPDMSDKDKFIDEWMKRTQGLGLKPLAELTWHLANREWESGYRQGVSNPDFE